MANVFRSKRLPRRVYWCRHALSLANKILHAAIERGDYRFILPIADHLAPIVEEGESQSVDLGRWFGQLPVDERPTVIVFSEFLRTGQTGGIIVREAGITPRQLPADSRLNERCWGAFAGVTDLGVHALFPEEAVKRARLGQWRHRPPVGEDGRVGESRRDVICNRLRPFMHDVFAQTEGENLLIVSHSEIVLCARKVLEGMTEAQAQAMNDKRSVPNCSVTSYVAKGMRLVQERAYFVAPKSAVLSTTPSP